MLGTFIDFILLIHKHKYYANKYNQFKQIGLYLFRGLTGFN